MRPSGIVVVLIATIRRRRWGLVVWASLVTAVVFLQSVTQVLDLPEYAFEQTGRVELASTVLAAIASWIAVWRVSVQIKPAG